MTQQSNQLTTPLLLSENPVPQLPPLPPSLGISDLGRAAILQAFRDEIGRLLAAEKFGAGELHTIERLALQARQVIGAAIPGERTSGGPYILDNPYMGGGFGQVLAPSSQVETIGASAMRELAAVLPDIIDGLKKKKEPAPAQSSMEDLIFAISTARKEGLTDVAKHLEAELNELVKPGLPGLSEELKSKHTWGSGFDPTHAEPQHEHDITLPLGGTIRVAGPDLPPPVSVT